FFKGFQVFAIARVWLLFLRKKKLLALPPAMRREDYSLEEKPYCNKLKTQGQQKRDSAWTEEFH
ncbi:hypothetical protein, partial [Pedobacter alpinus]